MHLTKSTMGAARSQVCLWLYQGKGKLRLGKHNETSHLTPGGCLLLEPLGVAVMQPTDKIRNLARSVASRTKAVGPMISRLVKPAACACVAFISFEIHILSVLHLLNSCTSALLSAGYWTVHREFHMFLFIYHSCILYLKLTYSSYVFIFLVFMALLNFHFIYLCFSMREEGIWI